MLRTVPLAALAALLIACWGAQAAPGQPQPCSFASQQPRYWQVATPLSALHVAPQTSFFMGDALLRTVTRQLGLAPCQVLLTAGVPCAAAMDAVPCADPLWLCGGGVLTVSNSVYQAAKSGLCDSMAAAAATAAAAASAPSPGVATAAAPAPLAAATASPARQASPVIPQPVVCQTLIDYPEISELVAADACEPVCFAQMTGTANDSSAAPSSAPHMAPPPPPAAAGACVTFSLQIDAASAVEAAAISVNLHNATTSGALQDELASFAAARERIQFVIGDSEVATAVGFGFFPPPSPPPSPPPPRPSPPPPSPPPPSPPPPLIPFLPGNSSEEAEDLPLVAQSMDTSGQLIYGEWGHCSAACGDGWQTRTASCLSASGALLALAQCPGATGAVTYRACSGPPCSSSFWQYSAWTACNATCGGGMSTRTATCQEAKGSTCDPEALQPTEQECNTTPCELFAWQAEWSACNATCGGGIQSRAVTCIDPGTGQAVSEEQCAAAGAKPYTEQPCNPQPCDFCTNNGCFGHGSCENGACACSPELNFTGTYCQVPVGCSSGVVDVQLQCCDSGLVDSTGACCPAGAVLDGAGTCCASGSVDACGVCGGTGKFLDISGACCATLPDANGMCCKSGVVDECGVCDGTGNSCAIELRLTFEVSPSLVVGSAIEEKPLDALLASLSEAMKLPEGTLSVDSLREVAAPTADLAVSSSSGSKRLLLLSSASEGGAEQLQKRLLLAQDGGPLYLTDTITLDHDTVGEGDSSQFSSAWMDAVLAQVAAQTASHPVKLAAGSSVQRVGVCGNGICEIAERSVEGLLEGTCPEDCSFSSKPCASGCVHGSCLPASGYCQCFAGYAGTSCSDCAAGYAQVNGTCVADVVALGLAALPPGPESDSDALATPGTINADGAAAEEGGSNVNVGAIVGPIVAVAVVCLLTAVFVVHRRQKAAFRNFASTRSPTNSGDVESQYTSAHDEAGTGPGSSSDTRSLREKYGSASSMAALSSHGTIASHGGGGGPHSLRQSQESLMLSSQGQAGEQYSRSLHGSQEQFKSMHAAAFRVAAASPGGPIASATPGMLDSQPVRQSLSTGRGGSQAATSTGHSSLRNTGSSGQPAPSIPESSHLAAASMAVHPMQSAAPSMLSAPSRVPSVGQLAGMFMQSINSSPMDPQARLFYNPAYNAEPGMSESKSFTSMSHVRPGLPVRLPMIPRLPAATTHNSVAPDRAQPAVDSPVRRKQSSNRSLDSLETDRTRRGRLDRLRAAVEALEADAAEGRLGSGARLAAPGELASPSTQVMNVRASVESGSVCWMGQDTEGAPGSPLALSAVAEAHRKFLDGRPEVPRLQLNKLHSGDEEARGSEGAYQTAKDLPYSSPGVPNALAPPLPHTNSQAHLVGPSGAAVPEPAAPPAPKLAVQAARIPAANFSSMDANFRHTGAVFPAGSTGQAPADPLDDLDEMLESARKPMTARDILAAGVNKLLGPLRSSKKGDWAGQLGTPRSWGASSGMQRTRAERSLQRSVDAELETEDVGPSASEAMAMAMAGSPSEAAAPCESMATAATSTGASGVGRYLNTPRGQLLQSLAAEAAVVQKHKGRGDGGGAGGDRGAQQVQQPAAAAAAGAAPWEAEARQPSFSEVMGAVQAALQAAGPSRNSSPSKIPRPNPAPLSRDPGYHSTYSSPSKIPRPPPLPMPPQQQQQLERQREQHVSADENLSLALPSPGKEQPAGPLSARAGGALGALGSLANTPRSDS